MCTYTGSRLVVNINEGQMGYVFQRKKGFEKGYEAAYQCA